MMKKRCLFSSILLVCVASCRTATKDSTLDAVDSSSGILFVPTIPDIATFNSLSKKSNSFAGIDRSLKFVIDLRISAKPEVYFMNANFRGPCRTQPGTDCVKYHYFFAKEQMQIGEDGQQWNDVTYGSNKKFVAGTLSSFNIEGKGLTLGFQLYPLDSAHDAAILAIATIVRKAVSIPEATLAFVATGDQQSTTEVSAKIEALPMLRLSINTILGSLNYIALNVGEAFGVLRMFPKNQEELLPTDIPVFDELPLDLSVVAATITHSFQDTNSHINLKSKERKTPNMVLRDAGPLQVLLAPWIDKPVRLVVGREGWTIEAATMEQVEEKLRGRNNLPWTTLKWTPSNEPRSYAAMCPDKPSLCLESSALFGGKAANLGFLKEIFRNRRIPSLPPLTYDPTPIGFGVPLQFYKDFIDLPANSGIREKLTSFIELEKSGKLSNKSRTQLAAELRLLILNAELPTSILTKVAGIVKELGPSIEKWKVRSSANAEDIENFDGAGLHDSYTVKVSSTDNPDHSCILEADSGGGAGELTKMKVKPKSFACAIKGVYASLWNKRAIEERSFALIDHASVAMGLAVVPSYDNESPVVANSVVVTRILNNKEMCCYSLSIQKDNNTVTNPTPGTWSEQTIVNLEDTLSVAPALTTLRFAKPTLDSSVMTVPILPADTVRLMARLTQKVEEQYCRSRPGYYQGNCAEVVSDKDKPKSLDLEMKYLQNGQFVLKQVREFGGK